MLFIFWISAIIIFFTYVGYPLTIWALSKIKSAPVNKGNFTPPISIIIVGYNEELRIADKINNLLSLDYDQSKIEIIVASDGSTDNTSQQVLDFNKPNIKFLSFPERRGKAACLNDAVAVASYEYIVFADVRQRFQKNALTALLSNFNDDDIGAVSGELVFTDEEETSAAASVDAYWRYEKFIRASEAKVGSVPGVTGAIYAIKKDLFSPIPAGTILDDVLIPLQMMIEHRKRVIFESEAVAYDKPSTDIEKEKVRKKRTLAGNYQLLALKPAVLSPVKNPIFFQFFSHKILRLIAPVFLSALLISSFFLTSLGIFYWLALLAQIGFYSLYFIGLKVEFIASTIFGKIAQSFCMMNWFAVLGFWQYVKNRNTHLW